MNEFLSQCRACIHIYLNIQRAHIYIQTEHYRLRLVFALTRASSSSHISRLAADLAVFTLNCLICALNRIVCAQPAIAPKRLVYIVPEM